MTPGKVVVKLGFYPEKVSANFAYVFKHVGEMAALNVISNITRISVGIITQFHKHQESHVTVTHDRAPAQKPH